MTVLAIPLYRRDGSIACHAVIDADDACVAGAYRWSVNRYGYAVRVARVDGRERSFLLHREILGLVHGDGLEGDHIDGDPLNNRRNNLRVSTRRMNGQNVRGWRGSSSSYRGVHFYARTGRWTAHAKLNGRKIHLGYFDDELAAARAASRFRAEHMPFTNEARERVPSRPRPPLTRATTSQKPEYSVRIGAPAAGARQ